MVKVKQNAEKEMPDADENVPFVAGKYPVKSVQRDALTPVQQLALDIAFPGFQGIEEPTARQSEEMSEADRKAIQIGWQQRPARRYAGDDTLPPNRYKTLLRSGSGDDGGTLSLELLAYHNPKKGGAIGVADCWRPEIAQFFTGSSSPVHQLIVSFLSWPDQQSPIWTAGSRTGLLPEIERRNFRGISRPDETYVAIEVPYQLDDVEFNRVIDLRFPKCQAWFLQTFGGSDLERHFNNDPNWTAFLSFPKMLPSLLWAEPGGSMFQGTSQYIGH